MESSGFSSPRTECFPAGLRVLVVDDDPTWLKILEKMLKKCNYEVTTCNLAIEALNLLRERKDGYDIVISDVNMPDMDGFKLLEHVGLEMDLPVIMMSVDGETSRVMKGVQHGACDYLLKPIRMKELRNIWQHVFRKRIHEVRDIEGHESLEEIQMMRSGSEQFDDGYSFNGDLISGKKRRDVDHKHEDRMCGDPSSLKKARVVWTVDLHQKFVKAVNLIGFEKFGPKKILDLMGVPWLTRENVASHLQKYRLYLTRLQKENEVKATFGATKHSEISPKDLAASVCHQNSVTQNSTSMQHNILSNESFTVSRNSVRIHNDEPKTCDGSAKSILSMPMTEPKKANSTSSITFDHSFRPLDSNVKSESTIQTQYSWNTEMQPIRFKQDHKPPFQTEPKFDHLTMPMHPIRVEPVQHGLAHHPGTSDQDCDKQPLAGFEKVTKVKNTPALFSVQLESHLTGFLADDPIPCSTWNTKNHSSEQNLFDDLESFKKNVIFGWDEKLNNDYSSLGEFHPPNGYFGNIESFGYNNHELISDVPPHLYDALKFDPEYASEPVEYPVIDQGLFIA